MVQNGKMTCVLQKSGHLFKPIGHVIDKSSTVVDRARTSGLRQFVVLLQMMLLKTVRNKRNLGIQVSCYIFCSILLGLMYFQRSNDGDHIHNTVKLCGIIPVLPVLLIYLPNVAHGEFKTTETEF